MPASLAPIQPHWSALNPVAAPVRARLERSTITVPQVPFTFTATVRFPSPFPASLERLEPRGGPSASEA